MGVAGGSGVDSSFTNSSRTRSAEMMSSRGANSAIAARTAGSTSKPSCDAKRAARLRNLRLHGRGDELRCIETMPAKGEVQRTLMGAAAQAAAEGADLAALCRGQGG